MVAPIMHADIKLQSVLGVENSMKNAGITAGNSDDEPRFWALEHFKVESLC